MVFQYLGGLFYRCSVYILHWFLQKSKDELNENVSYTNSNEEFIINN